MDILTPEQAAALEEAAAEFKKLAEALNEFAESIKENYADFLEELKECVEIPERETYEPCLKIAFRKLRKLQLNYGEKIALCLDRTREAFNSHYQSVKEVFV